MAIIALLCAWVSHVQLTLMAGLPFHMGWSKYRTERERERVMAQSSSKRMTQHDIHYEMAQSTENDPTCIIHILCVYTYMNDAFMVIFGTSHSHPSSSSSDPPIFFTAPDNNSKPEKLACSLIPLAIIVYIWHIMIQN